LPWILDDPPRVDWERYHAFFSEWGTMLWQVITRHGFSG
jgi:hypothetical protein